MESNKEIKLLTDIAELRITIQKLKRKLDVITGWLNSKFDNLPVDIKDVLSYDDLCTDAENGSDGPETTAIKMERETPVTPPPSDFVRFMSEDTENAEDSPYKDVPVKDEQNSDDECSDDPLGGLSPPHSIGVDNALSSYYNQSESLKDKGNSIVGRPTSSRTLVVLLHDINKTNQRNNSGTANGRHVNILRKRQRLKKRKTYQEKINELLGKAVLDEAGSLGASSQTYSRFSSSSDVDRSNNESHTFRKNFQAEANPKSHGRIEHEKTFRCHFSECGKSFIYEHSFRSHMKYAHPDFKLLTSRRSSKTIGTSHSSSYTSYSKERLRRKQPKSTEFKCGKCLKLFRKESELKIHEAKKHDTNRPYLCHYSGCEMTFLHKFSFMYHMKTFHPDFVWTPIRRRTRKGVLGEFKCLFDGCDKSYIKKQSLVNHQKLEQHMTQSSENENEKTPKRRRFTRNKLCCQMCNQQFIDKPTFMTHLETYGDTFRCTFTACGKLFTRLRYLREHQIMKGHRMTYEKSEVTSNDDRTMDKDNILAEDRNKSCTVDEEIKTDASGDANSLLLFCPQCGEGCTTRELLNEHVFHSCYKCKYCKKPFALKSEMERHVLQCPGGKKKSYYVKVEKYKDGNIICVICQSKFTTEIELENHVVEHSVRLFACSHTNCKKKFAVEEEVQEHESRLHCGTCYKSYPHLANFKVHNDKEHLGLAQFSTAEHLSLNNADNNGAARRFENGLQCLACSALFERYDLLRFHVEQGCHQCQFCGLQCKNGGILRQHIKLHEGIRPFLCNICGCGFSRKHTLQRHMDSKHTTNKKTFKCMSCDKIFFSTVGYFKHVKVHDAGGIPRKQCTICGFDFADDICLQKHISAIHENRRPYSCHLCEKKFKTTSALKYHVKTHDNPNGRKRGLNKDVDDLVAAAKRRNIQK